MVSTPSSMATRVPRGLRHAPRLGNPFGVPPHDRPHLFALIWAAPGSPARQNELRFHELDEVGAGAELFADALRISSRRRLAVHRVEQTRRPARLRNDPATGEHLRAGTSPDSPPGAGRWLAVVASDIADRGDPGLDTALHRARTKYTSSRARGRPLSFGAARIQSSGYLTAQDCMCASMSPGTTVAPETTAPSGVVPGPGRSRRSPARRPGSGVPARSPSIVGETGVHRTRRALLTCQSSAIGWLGWIGWRVGSRCGEREASGFGCQSC